MKSGLLLERRRIVRGLALDTLTRRVVAVYAGGCAEEDAKVFWVEVPEPYRSKCDIYTDE